MDQPTIALRQVVLDTTDARMLAEFYRQLLGFRYRPGDDHPPAGEPDPNGQDWLVLRNPAGGVQVAFAQVAVLPEATWPDGPQPQMLHLDLTVPTAAALEAAHTRALDRYPDPADTGVTLPSGVDRFVGHPLPGLRHPHQCRPARAAASAPDNPTTIATTGPPNP